jgi:hypothetical protein
MKKLVQGEGEKRWEDNGKVITAMSALLAQRTHLS